MPPFPEGTPNLVERFNAPWPEKGSPVSIACDLANTQRGNIVLVIRGGLICARVGQDLRLEERFSPLGSCNLIDLKGGVEVHNENADANNKIRPWRGD